VSKGRIELAIKRGVDLAVTTVGLTLGAPLQLGIAAAIRLDSPGPALFAQERVGQDGKRFHVYKFRTMAKNAEPVRNADGSMRVAERDARVTRVGRWLRGGLDELPQLLNVARGDMSVVGPRPDMVEHEKLYTETERGKLAVRPGITSLAAVLGRNEIPWKQRIAIDLRYIEHWSVKLDLQIIAATLCLPLGVRPFSFREVLGDLADEPLARRER
jgi:lipopolysaccharide/colanic/teichoic acid biosynthesis glycosyltransferase